MNELEKYLTGIIRNLPHQPGVYQFFNRKGEIIYVGKAKDLQKRVSSYFLKKKYDNFKVKVLVEKITDIKTFVVNSESDALLLENNLIKTLQPKYNVLLKDDKTFPWIVIKNEDFPRVFSTRQVVQDGSEYFGPYTSAYMVKTLLTLVRQMYRLRTCTFPLTPENIHRKKYKLCLEYHIGNCLGPCQGLQEEEDYQEQVAQIVELLKGNLKELKSSLEEKMKKLAANYEFERANQLKEKIEILGRFQGKTTIVNPAIDKVDVFSIDSDDKSAYINYLHVKDGAIIYTHTFELRKKLNEPDEELLQFAIFEMRQRSSSQARELILPMIVDLPGTKLKQSVPQKGDKLKLLELSQRNARAYKLEKLRNNSNLRPLKPGERVLRTLQTDLRLQHLPLHIECFDNSNLQGTNPVAACVVFKNGKPAKKEYRHFHVKTVVGPDDFASMREILGRRYSRLLEEKQPLPQLIIVDGGKGQLSAAVGVLDKLGLRGKVALIGIAKRLEEIYFPDDPVPLYIDKNSESLKLIQHLRNEAHRFGITFHRKLRSAAMISSGLEDIKGVGPGTIEKLYTHLKSMEAIQNASLMELAELIGPDKARRIISYFGNDAEAKEPVAGDKENGLIAPEDSEIN